MAEILFRVKDELHARIKTKAERAGKSMNEYLKDLVEKDLQAVTTEPKPQSKIDLAEEKLWESILDGEVPTYGDARMITGLTREQLKNHFPHLISTKGQDSFDRLKALSEQLEGQLHEVYGRLDAFGRFFEPDEQEKKDLEALKEKYEHDPLRNRQVRLNEVIEDLEKEQKRKKKRKEMIDAGYALHRTAEGEEEWIDPTTGRVVKDS